MKLPRDVSGAEIVKALRVLGYQLTRQRGSHMRITTQLHGEHHEVVPQSFTDPSWHFVVPPQEHRYSSRTHRRGADRQT